MQIQGSTPDLLNQKLWGWGPALGALMSLSGHFEVLKERAADVRQCFSNLGITWETW